MEAYQKKKQNQLLLTGISEYTLTKIMELQKLIHECKDLNVKSDLGICQIELNKYSIYLESLKPKTVNKPEILDCNYCGRRSADTGCMNHPNICKNPRYETN